MHQGKSKFQPAFRVEIKPRAESVPHRSSRATARPKYVSTLQVPSTESLGTNLVDLWKDDVLLSSGSPLQDLLYYRELRRKKDFKSAWNAFPSIQESKKNAPASSATRNHSFSHSRSARSFYGHADVSPTKKHYPLPARLVDSSISTESGWTEPSSELGDSTLDLLVATRKKKQRHGSPPEESRYVYTNRTSNSTSKPARRLEPPGRHSMTLLHQATCVSGSAGKDPLDARRSRFDHFNTDWQREYLPKITTTKSTRRSKPSLQSLSNQYDQKYTRALDAKQDRSRIRSVRGHF